MVKPKFHSTAEVGDLTGKDRTTVWRICRQNPGFAVQCGPHFKIPDDHLRQLLAGVPVEAIASAARAGVTARAA